jgi:radical SAM superfamily enzyme YgiQ (UPF0313 family)
VFCAIDHTRYRQFSSTRVVEEIKQVHDLFKTKVIAFQDDLFMRDKNRIRKIISKLRDLGLLGIIGFGVSLRADLIDEEGVELLKELNVMTVFMGIESGSLETLRFLKAGTLTVERIQQSPDLLHAHDIKVEGSFIIGSPRETRKELRATYDFIFRNFKEGKLTFTAVNLLTPYPGTRVWAYAKDRGLVDDLMDFTKLNLTLNKFDPYNCVYLNEVIPLPEFTKYIEIFEELHFNSSRRAYLHLSDSYDELYNRSRLDREKLKRFREESGCAEGAS